MAKKAQRTPTDLGDAEVQEVTPTVEPKGDKDPTDEGPIVVNNNDDIPVDPVMEDQVPMPLPAEGNTTGNPMYLDPSVDDSQRLVHIYQVLTNSNGEPNFSTFSSDKMVKDAWNLYNPGVPFPGVEPSIRILTGAPVDPIDLIDTDQDV